VRRTFAAFALALAACADTASVEGVGRPYPYQRIARLDAPGELVLPRAGTPVVVNVWATWCEPCRREMQTLERLDRLSPAGIRVIGISVDDDAYLAQEFLRRERVTFPNGVDARSRLSAGEWRVTRFPTTFLVDGQGIVRLREERARDWMDEANIARLKAALAP